MEKRILVVDDEPFILKSLLFIFRKEGYEVTSAISGEDALAELRRVRPQLLFLDIMLPGRDGYDICREIKEDPELGSTYVVLLTAKGQTRDREKAFAVGADDYVTKPFSPSRIIELARSFFERAPAAGEAAGPPSS